jgi:hypothetical protein
VKRAGLSQQKRGDQTAAGLAQREGNGKITPSVPPKNGIWGISQPFGVCFNDKTDCFAIPGRNDGIGLLKQGLSVCMQLYDSHKNPFCFGICVLC